MSEKKYTILPADDAVQNWFEGNIDKECSASSAVYKFRQWLESLQGVRQSGAMWVKASTRLPEHFQAKFVIIEGGKSVAAWHKDQERFVDDAGDFHPADQVEWLDESATPAAPKPYDDLYRLVFSNLAKLRARTQENDRMVRMADQIRQIIEEVSTKMMAMPQPAQVNDLWQLRQSAASEQPGREVEAVELWDRHSECIDDGRIIMTKEGFLKALKEKEK